MNELCLDQYVSTVVCRCNNIVNENKCETTRSLKFLSTPSLADPGGAAGARPQQDQFLSFSQMFLPKSVCVGGWRPPPQRVGAPHGKSWIRHCPCILYQGTRPSRCDLPGYDNGWSRSVIVSVLKTTVKCLALNLWEFMEITSMNPVVILLRNGI